MSNSQKRPRITGGIWRGRTLLGGVPPNVRPTSSRVREAICSIVLAKIRDACVLDAFGGAGTMSIEFRSRGAASVLTFEKDPSAHAAIEKSFLAFNDPEGLVVKKTDVIRFLRAGPDGDAQPFDLVILDPPYQSDLGQQTLALLVEQNWLAKGAVVLLECDTRKEEPISHSGLAIRSSRRYGDTTLYIFDYCE